MRARLGQYLNEVVSLSIMMLMTIALIAGQAGATVSAAANTDADKRAAPASFLDASARIETDFAVITLHIDMILDDVVEALPVDDMTDTLSDVVGIRLQAVKQ